MIPGLPLCYLGTLRWDHQSLDQRVIVMEGAKFPSLPPICQELDCGLDWEWFPVQFASEIPAQTHGTAGAQDTQEPVVSLQPYYFDIEDYSIKEASLDLPPHLVTIDNARLELIRSSLPCFYYHKYGSLVVSIAPVSLFFWDSNRSRCSV